MCVYKGWRSICFVETLILPQQQSKSLLQLARGHWRDRLLPRTTKIYPHTHPPLSYAFLGQSSDANTQEPPMRFTLTPSELQRDDFEVLLDRRYTTSIWA